MAPRGRPPLPGARDQRGRRRDLPDGRGVMLWQRARAARAQNTENLLDPRMATPLGQIELLHLLTETQIAAANLMGRIYLAYDRWCERSRNAPSPGYVRSIVSDQPADAAENEAIEPETPEDKDVRGERTERRYAKLRAELDLLPGNGRAILESLIIDEMSVHSSLLPSIGFALDLIAKEFNLDQGRHHRHDIRITARRPPRRARDRGHFVKRPDPAKEAWFATQRQISPNLDAAGLEKAWATLQDLTRLYRDRDRYRMRG